MKVDVFNGPLSGFRKLLPNDYMSIVDLALLDDSRNKKIKVDIPNVEYSEEDKIIHIDNVIAFSDDYASLTEGSIESFTNLILRYDINHLILQNPPNSISRHISELRCVDYDEETFTYNSLDIEVLKKINRDFNKTVIGQEDAKKKIISALYNVAKQRYGKPCVLLFYGSTGVGKTESAKFLADRLGEKLFRKQFSMLHSEEFSSYIFGGKHNQGSLAKDLLERESNVILFDEFDKPHPVFHSAFYQLFDEGIYSDRNFTVSMTDSVIICTSNYMTEKEIKEALGEPIFSRFDSVIYFEKLSKESIELIMKKEFDKQYNNLDEQERSVIEKANLREALFSLIDRLTNARQVRKIIREAISATLVKELL